MMISGTVKPNFWSRLLLSIIAIFALPNAESFENQNNAENYSSSVSIQQALETVKDGRGGGEHTTSHSSTFNFSPN